MLFKLTTHKQQLLFHGFSNNVLLNQMYQCWEEFTLPDLFSILPSRLKKPKTVFVSSYNMACSTKCHPSSTNTLYVKGKRLVHCVDPEKSRLVPVLRTARVWISILIGFIHLLHGLQTRSFSRAMSSQQRFAYPLVHSFCSIETFFRSEFTYTM